jgi:hypothetical protein
MSVLTLEQRLVELRDLRRRIDAEIHKVTGAIDDQRPRRRRNGEPAPCGTEQGYQWHRRSGVTKDRECLDAHAEYERRRKALRRAS